MLNVASNMENTSERAELEQLADLAAAKAYSFSVCKVEVTYSEKGIFLPQKILIMQHYASIMELIVPKIMPEE